MRALIIVDVQKDFCEGGALPVQGGTRVAANITQYLKDHPNLYDKLVLTRDWHTPGEDNGGHFSKTPDYKDTWPEHCVRGTKGAQFADGLSIGGSRLHTANEIRKGQHKPAYSGFDGIEYPNGSKLDAILAEADIVDVCGLAFDYCVKATALDAVRLLPLAQTNVLLDLTASVSNGTGIAAAVEMAEAGVHIFYSWLLR